MTTHDVERPATPSASRPLAPCCIWLTGLSGAGKSTLASLLQDHLRSLGLATAVLDGDALRRGLCSDLGYADADRVENIRRVAEVARLMVDAGVVVVASLISPFRRDRQSARARFQPGEFIEVFIDTPLAVCEARDTKGLYARARRGELKQFTGIDSAYEPPERPEMTLHCGDLTAAQALSTLLSQLRL